MEFTTKLPIKVNESPVGIVNPPFAVIRPVELNTPLLFMDEVVNPLHATSWNVFVAPVNVFVLPKIDPDVEYVASA